MRNMKKVPSVGLFSGKSPIAKASAVNLTSRKTTDIRTLTTEMPLDGMLPGDMSLGDMSLGDMLPGNMSHVGVLPDGMPHEGIQPGFEPLGEMPLGEMPLGDMLFGDMLLGGMLHGRVLPNDMPHEGILPGNKPLGDMPLGGMPLGNEPLGNEPLGDEPLGDMPPNNMPLGDMPPDRVPRGRMSIGDMPPGLHLVITTVLSVILALALYTAIFTLPGFYNTELAPVDEPGANALANEAYDSNSEEGEGPSTAGEDSEGKSGRDVGISAADQNANVATNQNNEPAQVNTPSAAQGATPSTQGASPSAQGTAPSAHGASPSAQGVAPSAQGASPSAQGASPSAQGTSPSAQGTSPSAQGSSPSAQGTSPLAQGASPSVQGAFPSARGASPSAQGVAPSAQGATPSAQGRAQTGAATTTQPIVAPKVSLRLSRSEYPRVDGSTATIPLSVMLAQTVTGMSLSEAEAFVSHTNTSQSFYSLAYNNADILVVYAPQEALFDELENIHQIEKSSFEIEPIGRDALIFLVNDQNPVKSLTHEQILSVYAGDITKWSSLDTPTGSGETAVPSASGPNSAASDEIVAFQRVKSSGSQVMMENLVMSGIDMAPAPTKLVVEAMDGLIENVAEYNNSSNAIGYSVYYYFNNMYNLEGVRALSINGVPCTNETIRDGSYPYVQDFYAVIRSNEPANSSTRKLFNLLTGAEGQTLIEAAGYVSISGSGTGGISGTGTSGVSGGVSGSGTSSVSGSVSGSGTGGIPGAGTNIRPVDTLSTIKRRSAASFISGLFDGAKTQNIFPLAFGNKTGFVNGDGELVIEPLYDDVAILPVYDGKRYLYNYSSYDIPLYYYARVFKRDGNNAPNLEDIEYAAVIGPFGKRVHETQDSSITITAMNLEDNSLVGNRVVGSYRLQFIMYSDGREITLKPNEYFIEISGETRWVHDYVKNDYYLIDKDGKRITNQTYDTLLTYNDDAYIYQTGNRLVAVNRAGEEIYVFPESIKNILWNENSDLFIYESNAYAGSQDYNYHGLMDREYNKLTDDLWLETTPSNSGTAFSVVTGFTEGGTDRVMALTDKAGKRLTERDYNYIFHPDPGYTANQGGASGTAPRKQEYFLGQYYKGANSGSYETTLDLLDINGDVLFTNTESIRIIWVYGNYATFSLNDGKGNNLTGLKFLYNTSSLASIRDGWLVQPAYDTAFADADGSYIILGVHPYMTTRAAPAGERIVVFDAIRGKISFKGDYQSVRFAGYKSTERADTESGGWVSGSGASGGGASIFYAETATRKGYLNERGEWIVCLSRFDTLDEDG